MVGGSLFKPVICPEPSDVLYHKLSEVQAGMKKSRTERWRVGGGRVLVAISTFSLSGYLDVSRNPPES